MDFINLNEELKELKDNNSMTLVYFGSSLCSVCGALKPKVNELLTRYPEIKAVQVDTGKSSALAASNNMFTIPGILLFIDGKEAIREARFISVPDLERKIERYYKMYFED